jgi:hypothetical protein
LEGSSDRAGDHEGRAGCERSENGSESSLCHGEVW